jgi:hypothetical protein
MLIHLLKNLNNVELCISLNALILNFDHKIKRKTKTTPLTHSIHTQPFTWGGAHYSKP